jgi:hypothetical protein
MVTQVSGQQLCVFIPQRWILLATFLFRFDPFIDILYYTAKNIFQQIFKQIHAEVEGYATVFLKHLNVIGSLPLPYIRHDH